MFIKSLFRILLYTKYKYIKVCIAYRKPLIEIVKDVNIHKYYIW